jgi:hypothetical protein
MIILFPHQPFFQVGGCISCAHKQIWDIWIESIPADLDRVAIVTQAATNLRINPMTHGVQLTREKWNTSDVVDIIVDTHHRDQARLMSQVNVNIIYTSSEQCILCMSNSLLHCVITHNTDIDRFFTPVICESRKGKILSIIGGLMDP